MQPPFSVIEQPPLALQLFVERRIRIGHQNIERRKCEFIADRKITGRTDRIDGIAVMSDRKGRPCLQPVFPELRDLIGIHLRGSAGIRIFMHIADAVRRDRLKADDQSETAALYHQLHQLRILKHIHAALTDPADLQRDQRTEQLLCLCTVTDDIVIDEEQQLPLLRADLADHLIDRPAEMLSAEIDR